MRQKRAKSYRKQLLVYSHTFKFREPYQVLVDNQLVLECNNSNFNLPSGLKRTLQADVKVMITQCCIQALYETRNDGAINLAKQFERRRCNHSLKIQSHLRSVSKASLILAVQINTGMWLLLRT